MIKVFVSMVTFNSSNATVECLNSLEKVDKINIELFVIVIDNGSQEKFKIDKKFQNYNLKIIRNEKNLGFSGGQNIGIKYALENGADFIIVLNNDTLLDKNLIISLVSSLEGKAGIVSPKIYFAKGHEFHKERYRDKDLGRVIWYAGGIIDFNNVIGRHRGVDEVDNGKYDLKSITDFASGCCMGIKKDVFGKIGFFDERYFLYYEDNDFSQRAKLAGFDIVYQPKAQLWHKNAASAGGSGSSLQDYYITRNRLLFGMKFASFKTKLALIKESLNLIVSGRKWQKKGSLDFYLRNFGKGSYPI